MPKLWIAFEKCCKRSILGKLNVISFNTRASISFLEFFESMLADLIGAWLIKETENTVGAILLPLGPCRSATSVPRSRKSLIGISLSTENWRHLARSSLSNSEDCSTEILSKTSVSSQQSVLTHSLTMVFFPLFSNWKSSQDIT